MFRVEIYKYNSSVEGYRGEEYTKNLLQGSEIVEKLNQELDVLNITLTGLTNKESFTAESGFIVDIIEDDRLKDTLHFCVFNDIVNKVILSDNTYYDHHIRLVEPSVVAQKRLVNNISTTYKLQDVSLDTLVTYPTDTKFLSGIAEPTLVPPYNFEIKVNMAPSGAIRGVAYSVGKYFWLENEIKIYKKDEGITGGTQLKYIDINSFNVNAENPDQEPLYQAKINLPKLKVFGGKKGTTDFIEIGDIDYDYIVEEYDLTNNYKPTRTVVKGRQYANNDAFIQGISPVVCDNEYLYEDVRADAWTISQFKVKRYISHGGRPTEFSSVFTILPDKQYKILITLPNINVPHPNFDLYKGTPSYITYTIGKRDFIKPTTNYALVPLSSQESTSESWITTYISQPKKIVYRSSIPYSALSLIQKAIINSGCYTKKQGVCISNVNEMDLPFYIDENYIEKLKNTVVIENFYNQKNLWEIFVEAGNYIHAIPQLKFGKDNRYMLTFTELGKTDKIEDKGTKISIYNSRSIEDYISATSSYVDNFIQLGGSIAEWVTAKAEEETTIYNDTACIKTTKPIMELLSIQVRCNKAYTSGGITINKDDIADMTPFIFEKNIYDLLGIDPAVFPNRGVALYYNLGTNIIKGGQYKLPEKNETLQGQYAIKKVIYSAFKGYADTGSSTSGLWDKLQVNDFDFLIEYRTKDTARIEHFRPDLRKYLLNSKYDSYPQHNQFNNQQDVLIDSQKFGSKMYGKLIRTGNLSYEITEWHDTYDTLKHKGDLVEIDGDLYYVSTVKNIIFSTYILSTVTYSKDYNELSNVIGIPSEPRFYEISEQSQIRSEYSITIPVFVRSADYQSLNATNSETPIITNFKSFFKLIFGKSNTYAPYKYPPYVVMKIKGDKDATAENQTGIVGEPDTDIDLVFPINAYSSGNTLTYEWDMLNNFSAGDKVVASAKDNYNVTEAVRYTDIFGKAPLFDFYIIDYATAIGGNVQGVLPSETVKNLPESPIHIDDTWYNDNKRMIVLSNSNLPPSERQGICLFKDNREAISCNVNIPVLTSSDTFVISPFFWEQNKTDPQIVLLTEEVNKLNDGYINKSTILDNKYYPLEIFTGTGVMQYFTVTDTYISISVFSRLINEITDEEFKKVKAYAIVFNTNRGDSFLANYEKYIIARNLPKEWDMVKAFNNILIENNNNTIYKIKE